MNKDQKNVVSAKTDKIISLHSKSRTVEEATALAISECNIGNTQAAADIFQIIISNFPAYPEAYYNLGIVRQEMKQYDEALANFKKAISLKPDYLMAYYTQGVVLHEMKRYDEALASYDKAITHKPDFTEAYNNRSVTLWEMRNHDQALISFEKVIELRPDNAEAYYNLAIALHKFNRRDDALANYDKAIELNPTYASAYYNRGVALLDLRLHEEARESFRKALSLKSDLPYLLGDLMHTEMHLASWKNIDDLFALLAKEIDAGKKSASPFSILATPLSSAHQRKCAEIYVSDKFPSSAARLWNGERYSHNRIRIGYFSADFNGRHPLPTVMAEFFERHDRSKFEVTAFSFSLAEMDDTRKRLEKSFEHFVDVSAKSEQEIATLARQMEIDIAIDLNGLTGDLRTGIFALRPAPVQVSYMGYPGTMGADYIDYVVADSTVIPEESKQYYSEKIAYLPHSYWVIDSTKDVFDTQFTRKDMGLPEDGFVFCCFNKGFKITSDVFDIWMRLLHKVEGSVLWLMEGNPTASKNLRREAEARGISGDRLIFAQSFIREEHLARHNLADLFLDTFYYNAHTTTSDALWAGLPVITCLGNTFAGRVAASLLQAANLPELVTHSSAEYETLALELATNPQKLSALRKKMIRDRSVCPLFHTALFTKHFEDAYREMWKKSQLGLPADHIYVQA